MKKKLLIAAFVAITLFVSVTVYRTQTFGRKIALPTDEIVSGEVSERRTGGGLRYELSSAELKEFIDFFNSCNITEGDREEISMEHTALSSSIDVTLNMNNGTKIYYMAFFDGEIYVADHNKQHYSLYDTKLFDYIMSMREYYIGDLPKFTFDESGNYTGFTNLPSDYTIEDAKADGYLVTQGIEIVANKNVWDSFVEDSFNKKNTCIRMVSFFTGNADSPYFKDLFYRDGYYYAFDSSAETQEKHPYIYLLTLEGQFGNPLRDSSIIILTDDNTLTFDKVMSSALSSDINYKKSISPYKLIMIK